MSFELLVGTDSKIANAGDLRISPQREMLKRTYGLKIWFTCYFF